MTLVDIVLQLNVCKTEILATPRSTEHPEMSAELLRAGVKLDEVMDLVRAAAFRQGSLK